MQIVERSVLGVRAAPSIGTLEPVATLEHGRALPPRIRRTTAETLVKIIIEAKSYLRFAAPFVDDSGMRVISEPLAAATARGVEVEILQPSRSSAWPAAVQSLRDTVLQQGNPARIRFSSLRFDSPWAHLKILLADGIVAYVGSANLTGPGVIQGNLEFGVLVFGSDVRTFEQVLDAYLEH